MKSAVYDGTKRLTLRSSARGIRVHRHLSLCELASGATCQDSRELLLDALFIYDIVGVSQK